MIAVTKDQLLAVLVVITAGMIFAAPHGLLGLSLASDDGVIHYTYFVSFRDQVLGGEFYPRWLINQNAGLGSPAFYYYPPLAYYFTLVFSPLPVSELQQLGLAVGATVVLSGVAAFLWLVQTTPPRAAAVAALMYMILPYRTLDIFDRGAFAELFTFIWMPLILFFISRFVRGSFISAAGIAITVALLSLSHLLTTMMFIPFACAYAAFEVVQFRMKWRGLWIFCALGVGFGLAGVYILPAMMSRDLVSMEGMIQGHGYYANSFLTSRLRISGSLKYFHMTYQVALLALLLFLAARRSTAGYLRQQFFFWAACFGAALLMTFSVSRPIWEMLTPLQWVQFPWRFHTVICVALAAMLGIAVSRMVKPQTTTAALCLVCMVIVGIICINDLARKTIREINKPVTEIGNYEQKMRFIRRLEDSAAYWPRTVPAGVADLENLLDRVPKQNDVAAKAYVATGDATVTVERWSPRSIAFNVDTSDPAAVVIGQLYFPGWTAVSKRGDDETILPVSSDPTTGLVCLSIPPGRQSVTLRLEMLESERLGWASTLFSFMVLGSFLFYTFFRRRERRQEPARERSAVSFREEICNQ